MHKQHMLGIWLLISLNSQLPLLVNCGDMLACDSGADVAGLHVESRSFPSPWFGFFLPLMFLVGKPDCVRLSQMHALARIRFCLFFPKSETRAPVSGLQW